MWEARKLPPIKIAKFLLQVKYEQLTLTISHASRPGLFYKRHLSWDAGTGLARPSKRHTCLCKNGIGDLTHSFCLHTLGMHCHLGSNSHPLTQTYKVYAYYERNARQNAWKKSATERITLISVF